MHSPCAACYPLDALIRLLLDEQRAGWDLKVRQRVGSSSSTGAGSSWQGSDVGSSISTGAGSAWQDSDANTTRAVQRLRLTKVALAASSLGVRLWAAVVLRVEQHARWVLMARQR